jgi:hypothetical protein
MLSVLVVACALSVAFALPVPTKDDWKAMAENYWVMKVGPSDDITTWTAGSSNTYEMSFAGTPHGQLTGEEYLAGGKQMEQFGFAKTFGNDTSAALEFINEKTSGSFPSWNALQSCAHDLECADAWATDSRLIGHNATLVSVVKQLDGTHTLRCHAHPQGMWCHQPEVAEFNEGSFYVVEAQVQEEKYLGLVMCHDFTAQQEGHMFEAMFSKCHTMPVGLVVPRR